MIFEWSPPKGTPTPSNWEAIRDMVDNPAVPAIVIPAYMVKAAKAALGSDKIMGFATARKLGLVNAS